MDGLLRATCSARQESLVSPLPMRPTSFSASSFSSAALSSAPLASLNQKATYLNANEARHPLSCMNKGYNGQWLTSRVFTPKNRSSATANTSSRGRVLAGSSSSS